MPNDTLPNKTMFRFYESVKKGNEVWSYEELELAIQTLENAREGLREREQKRLLQKQAKQRRKKTEKTREKTIRLSAKTKRVPAEAYWGREDITRLVTGEGVTEIGKGAFAGCKNLKEIIFPSNRILLRRAIALSPCLFRPLHRLRPRFLRFAALRHVPRGHATRACGVKTIYS